MYVVFADELEEHAILDRPAATLEQAFAVIVCRCGYAYAFERGENGWSMILTDVENPAYSPDRITTTYEKADAAKRDLVAQACDGRLKGYSVLPLEDFEKRKAQIMALQASGEYEAGSHA